MDGLKQAIQVNTLTALESAIKNAESVTGFNPPELRAATFAFDKISDMLEAKVGSGQTWGRARVIGHTHTHTHTRTHTLYTHQVGVKLMIHIRIRA